MWQDLPFEMFQRARYDTKKIMIALLSKNDRARPLFELLTRQSDRFKDFGQARPTTTAKVMARLISLRPDLHRARLDAQFSPIQCASIQRSCERLLGDTTAVEAVLYWGATNLPSTRLPYFIITDGPFDPHDADYPAEWAPVRWAKNYFERQRRVYTKAKHVFTLSRWAADKIQKLHGLGPERVTVIGWGPIHSFGPQLEPENPPYFVSVGSEWYRKGMDVIADAAEQLHTTNPECSVVIAGAPRGLSLQERPGLKLIPHSIPAARAQELISKARGFIIGSRFDASPHVIMEAFQAGTPVIGSKVCGIPEAISPGMGYLVAPGDSAGFAEAMRRCLAEDPKQQRANVYEHYRTALRGWQRSAEILSTKIAEVL